MMDANLLKKDEDFGKRPVRLTGRMQHTSTDIRNMNRCFIGKSGRIFPVFAI
jgi:hypothetical protein